MGKTEKQAYLKAIGNRYRRASRQQKSRILDEFCAVCGYHRKYALRQLAKRKRNASLRKPGRPSHYAVAEVLVPLKAIWMATDQMASKRLKSALPLWLPHYEARQGALSDVVRGKLYAMSPATIDRLLAPARAKVGGRGLSGTKPGSLIKTHIPLQVGTWDATQPGFIEADTVAHCGTSLAGNFAWSLTMTDLYSGWTECRATWNKGSNGVMTQIKSVQKMLPFRIRGFDCDNGSEFLNWHLLRYFQDHPSPIQFTRSRPYHKNDNAHVEQKNWSCVRQLFGYERFDQPGLVDLMNDLYANEVSLLNNYFSPTMKLASKKRIGAKIVKRHGIPETPAQRLLTHEAISLSQKERLKEIQKHLDPFQLRAIIQRKLRAFFNQIRATKR